jgi:inner membrane protein
VLLPATLLTVLPLVDLARDRPLSLLTSGVLDEVGHLATAVLVLTAAAGNATLRRHRTVVLSALIASVAIDADHVPLYAGVSHIAADGRPFSHSLTTVVVLIAAASALPRRRRVIAGAALGVTLHFLRDVGTGPGLPLWWPISAADVRVPYALYLGTLVALAAVATLRRASDKVGVEASEHRLPERQ